jgi:hypothetical protein
MTAAVVIGLEPRFPWPLGSWRWWTAPVRAERLAALRIGLAGALLVDQLTTYLPGLHLFFGAGSLGGPEVLPDARQPAGWGWSLLAGVESPVVFDGALAVWILATVLLLVGLAARPAAAVVWVLSSSFARINPEIDNAGDTVRGIILFYLMLAPCGAVWSLDAWWRHRRRPAATALQATLVHPWPLRLLFVQMMWIYFSNGLHKLAGMDWLEGVSLYYALADLTLARWSYASWPMPFLVTRLLSWLVLSWEVFFPVLVLQRRVRIVALCFGLAFHLGIWACLEIGSFAPYMLCLYLPLVPWEKMKGMRDEG